MSDYALFTSDCAPENSKSTLTELEALFGFVPNLAAAMALSPVLLKGFVGLFKNVHGGTLTEQQLQTLLLTNAVTNRCSWAVAFHSVLALKEGHDPADVQAMRQAQPPSEPRHAALSRLTRSLIEQRGQIDESEVRRFTDAGFEKAHLLEVIGVAAASTMTNYAGSVTKPALEAAFQSQEWHA